MSKHPLCLGQGKEWSTLSAMRPGNVYWILSDNQEDLSQVAKETIKVLSATSHAAFIGFGSKPSDFLAGIFGAKIQRMPLYILPYRKAALLQLTDDLSRARLERYPYFIMHIPRSEIWEKISASQLNKWLMMIKKWVFHNHSTLLILQHTSNTDIIQKRLGANYDQIGGLSRFYRTMGNLQWMIDWWRTPEILIHNHTYDIESKKTIWQLNRNTEYDFFNNQFNDENDFLVSKKTLNGSPCLHHDWQIFDDNRALVNLGIQKKASTLILSLTNLDQIVILARQVHLLRNRCGRQIKIVIRELIRGSRFSDVKLLLLCGANLVIPHDLAYSQFLLMLESVRGQYYTRTIPTDINDILSAAYSIKEKGLVKPLFFAHNIEERIHNKILHVDAKGLLLKIQPKPALRPEQLVMSCRIVRQGDIITFINGWVYLFLSDCDLSEQGHVIHSIFHYDLHEISQKWVAVYRDDMILSEVQAIVCAIATETQLVSSDEFPERIAENDDLSSSLGQLYSPIAIDLLSNEPLSGELDAY